MARTLTIPARETRADGVASPSARHRIASARRFEFAADRAGARAESVQVSPGEAHGLVRLELDGGGVLWTSVARLPELFGGLPAGARDATSQRGEPEAFVVPSALPLPGATRDALGLGIRALSLLGIDVDEEIAKLGTAAAVAALESRLPHAEDLYSVASDGSLEPYDAAALAGDEPVLLLIHGTASSTEGSFGDFFRREASSGQAVATARWRHVWQRYRGRVLALEHHTLSRTPAANALHAVERLPPGVQLDLLTHSRGGLVGELLCRSGEPSAAALAGFRAQGEDADVRARQREQLVQLAGALREKRIAIRRFVRVACPASGTTLASERLDAFLSVLVDLVGALVAVPEVVDAITGTLLEIVRRRAEPAEVPGIEAQLPGSPLTRYLNLAPASSGDELRVVAGNLQGDGVWRRLRALAAYAFFGEANDLVVQTASMYGATGGRGGAVAAFHQSPAVSHFTYFGGRDTRQSVDAALDAQHGADLRPRGFRPFRGGPPERLVPVRRRDEAADVAAPSRAVLLVPDFLGSSLADDDGPLWPDRDALVAGRLERLAAPVGVVRAVGLAAPEQWIALERALEGFALVEPVPYDWRQSLDVVAAVLRERIETACAACDVHVIAHGYGALAVALALAGVPRPARLRRVVLLGPPTVGSGAVLSLALGEGALFESLCLLDGRGRRAALRRVFAECPAVHDQLPEPCGQPEWWRARAVDAAPSREFLRAGRARRRKAAEALLALDALTVLGAADRTVVSFERGAADARLRAEIKPDAGDGWCLADPTLAERPTARWLAARHERLPSAADLVAGIRDLLEAGVSARVPPRPPVRPETIVAAASTFPPEDGVVGLLAARVLGDEEAVVGPQLRAEVVHGSLHAAHGPVLVGHYEGDGLFGAERYLDSRLDGRLARRFAVRQYPGRIGDVLVVDAPPAEDGAAGRPPGAIVVGLGDVGDLTPRRLRRTVHAGVLEWALRAADARGDGTPHELTLSSLLIGTRGGRALDVRESIAAILDAVVRVNARLAEPDGPNAGARIARLEFVELSEDVAVAAARALVDAARERARQSGGLPDVHADDALVIGRDGRPGGRTGAAADRWWNRLHVSARREEDAGDAARTTGLEYLYVTDRARAPVITQPTIHTLVDAFLRATERTTSGIAPDSISHTLFDLLVPGPFKEEIADAGELVLVVDPLTARYPWELLMRRRSDDGASPALLGVVRQFRDRSAAEVVEPARGGAVLVVGTPQAPAFADLPGARAEAVRVSQQLTRARYVVETSIDEDASAVLQRLYANDYVVVHVAAHGTFDAADPARTGVVIGDDVRLTADVIRQLPACPSLVFLSCCHLGRTDEPQHGRFAASVAVELMRIGVRCLVVAGWAVDDAAARAFATAFYERLLDGETFGDAVSAARRSAHELGSTTWGAFQCYGDPHFRLTSAPWRGGEVPRYVSEREVAEELAVLRIGLHNLRRPSADSAERVRSRLAQVDAALRPEWLSARVLVARGRLRGELGDFEEAVADLRAALASDGSALRVEDIEQLANFEDRLAHRIAGGGADAARLARARQLWETAIERCRALDAIAPPTCERASLVGGAFKRRATHAVGRERRRLLAQAEREYARGVELAARGRPGAGYYPACNQAALLWALRRSARVVRAVLDAARQDHAQVPEARRDVWWQLAVVDMEILHALAGHALGARVARIRECFGAAARGASPRERDSVLTQLATLGELAPETAAGRRDAADLAALAAALSTVEGRA